MNFKEFFKEAIALSTAKKKYTSKLIIKEVPTKGVSAKNVSVSKNSVAFVDTNGNYWFCSNYMNPQWIQLTGSGGFEIRHRIPS